MGQSQQPFVFSGYRLTLCSPGCQFESRLSDLLVLGPNLINYKWDPRVLFHFSVGCFFEQTLCAVRQVTARVTRILQVYEQKWQRHRISHPPRSLDTMVIRVFTPLEVRSNGLGVVFVIMRNFQTLQRFFLQIKHSGLVCAAASSIQRLPGAHIRCSP